MLTSSHRTEKSSEEGNISFKHNQSRMGPDHRSGVFSIQLIIYIQATMFVMAMTLPWTFISHLTVLLTDSDLDGNYALLD